MKIYPHSMKKYARNYIRFRSQSKTVSPKGDPNRMVGTAKSGKASSRALREAAKMPVPPKQTIQAVKVLSFRRFVTKDGYEILSGRNNIQNDQLTFSTASRSDWWFHIKGLPGTHVILKLHPANRFLPMNRLLLQHSSQPSSRKAPFLKNILKAKVQAPAQSRQKSTIVRYHT